MLLIGVAVVVTLALLLAFRSLVVMLSWNWVMDAIFNVPEISFWQAVGLVILSSFLFGGIFDKNSVKTTKKADK
jgi:hypothetical protein